MDVGTVDEEGNDLGKGQEEVVRREEVQDEPACLEPKVDEHRCCQV